MKKSVYFFQVNYSYGNNNAHLPYTAAHLAAYAFADTLVSDAFELSKIFFLREPPERIMQQLDEPAVIGFSTYIWNCEYNLRLAEMIKERYPSCVIVFGGHHVPPGSKMLCDNGFIDYLIHGEGEQPLKRLLLSLIGRDDASLIPGVTYRSGDECVTNDSAVMDECDFPSPYLNGYFDDILRDYPDMEFIGLIETSRGCPNSCAYCDWSNMKSKIRMFSLDRVLAEIEWMGERRIFGFGAADSNFGFYERDELITDKIVETHLKTGYPISFQTSYSKGNSERVFNIGCKLDKYGISKGITLSFQSMSPTVLKNIGRHNIAKDFYSGLMERYSRAGVPTYTELILGLPGETYDSFAHGIEELLCLGQHNSLYIHNCEWLPCSIMGMPDYMERFDIRSTRIPLNQPHRDYDESDTIIEWSQLVTHTYTMDGSEWKRMNMFSFCVQALHHMGLTKLFAIYLYDRQGVGYREFYERLLEFFITKPQSVAGRVFAEVAEHLDRVLDESGQLVCRDERFGKVLWPFEEYIFLCISYQLREFYEELREFLARFDYEDGVFEDLLQYQREMIKQPFVSEKTVKTRFDFFSYFTSYQNGDTPSLNAVPQTLEIKTKIIPSWEEYARTVVWFGRKNNKNTYENDARQAL